MLNLMGFPQDATIIEKDNQACVYGIIGARNGYQVPTLAVSASEIPQMTRGMRHLDLAELRGC